MLKKVLIVYSSKPPIAAYLASSFLEKGIEAKIVLVDKNHWFDKYVIHTINKQLHNLRILPKSKQLFSEHRFAHKNYRSEHLLNAYNEFSPDLVLLIRGISIKEDVLKQIRLKSKLFGWWVEKEERIKEALAEIGFFDFYFFINSSCVTESINAGYTNVKLLHHSVDPKHFYKLENTHKKYDVCFVGNWSKKRQMVLEEVLQITENIAIYGGKWFSKNLLNPKIRCCVKGRYIDGESLVVLYNQSKIVLNVTNWGFGEGDRRSGMNMRILEVTATGSFLLTDGSKDLESVITPDEHLVVYGSMEDCLTKIKYYLENEPAREEIAKQGHRYVIENYNYGNIADEIKKAYLAL